MGDVVVIRSGLRVQPRGTPDANAVEEIDRIAELVHSGEVKGFAIAMVYSDNAYAKTYAGECLHNGLIGLLDRLKVTLMAKLDDVGS